MQSRWNGDATPCTREDMARSEWEAELEGVAGKRSGGSKFGRFLVAVLVVGGGTFVAAYYVPLLRAHRALTALYGQTKDHAHSMAQKLAEAESALKTTAAERDGLKEQERQRDTDAQSRQKRTDVLASELSEKLKKHFDKARLTLSTAGDRVNLSVAEGVLFAPGKDEPSAPGTALLCDVAKAAGSRPLRVRASVGGEPAAGAGKAWGARATVAARVADALAEKCTVPKERLSVAVVGGDEEAGHARAGDAFDGVLLTVLPP
jgi:chemotaxis protein MotB